MVARTSVVTSLIVMLGWGGIVFAQSPSLHLANLPPTTGNNRYFRDAELKEVSFDDIELEGVNHYSSTYYFLSRVVNACLAAQEGKEADYNSAINQLALRLPSIGDLAQGRIWLWRKGKRNRSNFHTDVPSGKR